MASQQTLRNENEEETTALKHNQVAPEDQIDAPPKMEAGEDDKEVDAPKEILEEHDWKYYFGPAETTKILNKNMKKFAAIIGLYYLLQFICCVCTASNYSHADRFQNCAWEGQKSIEEVSAVFDKPLLLLAIFHILEWIRTTVLLVVVCIGANLMSIWYFTCLNSVFGIVAYIYMHVVRYSMDGHACAETQVARGQWLIIETIIFWVTFFFFAFPMMVFRCCMKKQSLEATLNKGDSSDEED